MVGKHDPVTYNFLNGVLLGYPRGYIINMLDTGGGFSPVAEPTPERGYYTRFMDAVSFHVKRNYVSSLQLSKDKDGEFVGDGFFSRLFRNLTAPVFNNLYGLLGKDQVPNAPSPQSGLLSASKIPDGKVVGESFESIISKLLEE
jgi:hypothetical protein